MKNFTILVIALVLSSTIEAQSVSVIEYQETMKLDLTEMSEQLQVLPKAMLDMIPKSQSFEKELLFDSNKSIYRTKKGAKPEDMNMESGGGSIMIKFHQDDTEDILYTSLEENMTIHQKGIMGKSFIVSDEVKKKEWKLTNEKIKYLDYECQKAVIETEDGLVVAWYTSQIPTQSGPAKYNGLPGAILMLSIDDGALEIKATKVSINSMDSAALTAPSDGKKVSQKEFDKINEEKMKEQKEMYGNGNLLKIGN